MLAEVLSGLLSIKMHLLGHRLQAFEAGLVAELFVKCDFHDVSVGISRPIEEMDF
jgi:hypothetical protein